MAGVADEVVDQQLCGGALGVAESMVQVVREAAAAAVAAEVGNEETAAGARARAGAGARFGFWPFWPFGRHRVRS